VKISVQAGADVTFSAALSVRQIWDVISGTSDAHAADEDLVKAVLDEATARLDPRQLRILDLGGGAGNPGIGLAASGHDVTIVDNDASLLEAARTRAQTGALRAVETDWREFLRDAGGKGAQFDAILCLGNALAYQDSWPDRELPDRPTVDCLRDTVAACKRVLAPGGFVLIEVALEPDRRTRWQYVRQLHTAQPSGRPRSSVWIVDCDPRSGRRAVDTIILEESRGALADIDGRIEFVGHLVTSDTMSKLAQASEMHAEQLRTWPRSFLEAFVLTPRANVK